jgi:hypothetical protein
MTTENPTISLAEAMVVARVQSKLERWRVRYRCYYDSHPDKMRAKNSGYYQETSGYYPCEEQGVVSPEGNGQHNKVYGCHHDRAI